MVDTDRQHVLDAKMSDLEAVHVQEISEKLVDHVDFQGKGSLLAMTNSGAVNQLICSLFKDRIPVNRCFSLECSSPRMIQAPSLEEQAGITLFQEGIQYEYVIAHMDDGAQLKATRITDEFPIEKYRERFENEAIPLFRITDGNKLQPLTRLNLAFEEKNFTLISLVLSNETRPISGWESASAR